MVSFLTLNDDKDYFQLSASLRSQCTTSIKASVMYKTIISRCIHVSLKSIDLLIYLCYFS